MWPTRTWGRQVAVGAVVTWAISALVSQTINMIDLSQIGRYFLRSITTYLVKRPMKTLNVNIKRCP
jgi:hypothetical protein